MHDVEVVTRLFNRFVQANHGLTTFGCDNVGTLLIAHEYHQHFVGMTIEPVSLDLLLDTRARLRQELTQQLTERHKKFLIGLTRAQHDWTLLQCPHASELPALRWKLNNLQTFSQRRPADFEKQASTLERLLG